MFDFKKYHIRAMNAETEQEKTAINEELKAVYEKLSEAEKVIFNEELQKFLVNQYKNISDSYGAVN